MPDLKESDYKIARNVLNAFAINGFQKTSMEDIANAVGVSRQSIYKKFGSKEKCYEWTLHTYLSGMYARIFSTLNNEELPPQRTLVNVFNILIGDAIDIIRNAHGTEVLDDALRTTHASEEDWPLRFRARLATYLEHHDIVPSSKSTGIAFTLISAGKGLLLEEPSREQFLKDMTLIINSIKD